MLMAQTHPGILVETIKMGKQKRGQAWFDTLQAKAHTTSKLHPFENELLAKELKKEIEALK